MQLYHELGDNQVDEYRDLTGMDQGMGGFAFTPLFDISPISELQNSSSDCWPVLPKSHNLAMIGMDTALVGG